MFTSYLNYVIRSKFSGYKHGVRLSIYYHDGSTLDSLVLHPFKPYRYIYRRENFQWNRLALWLEAKHLLSSCFTPEQLVTVFSVMVSNV